MAINRPTDDTLDKTIGPAMKSLLEVVVSCDRTPEEAFAYTRDLLDRMEAELGEEVTPA